MLDTIIVLVIALIAAGYLFMKLRPVKNQDGHASGCGACGCGCNGSGATCNDTRPLQLQMDGKKKHETGNPEPGSM